MHAAVHCSETQTKQLLYHTTAVCLLCLVAVPLFFTRRVSIFVKDMKWSKYHSPNSFSEVLLMCTREESNRYNLLLSNKFASESVVIQTKDYGFNIICNPEN